PVRNGAEPLGTLILASAGAGGRRYTPNDVDFLVALADRASLAVRNARLVRELAAERDRQQLARHDAEWRAAELLAMFEADPNGLVLFHQDDRVRSVGPRLAQMFEWMPAHELFGRDSEGVFGPDARRDGRGRQTDAGSKG